MIRGSDVRAALGIQWPLVPSRDDGSQKRTTRPWKHLQSVGAGRPYDNLSAAMWSICTGAGTGVVVLDFDGAAGDAVRLAWGLTDPHVRTGSGGHHVYVKHPGWPVRTMAGAVPGVDVRGDGGVAHVAGASRKGEYVVLRPLTEPLAYAALPDEAKAVIKRKARALPDTRPAGWMPGPGYRAALIEWKCQELRETASGGRNQALNKASWSLAQQRVPIDEAMPALLAVAEEIGLGDAEAQMTVRSGWRSGAGGWPGTGDPWPGC